ncbi:helix-turn-helix domain-containing protein [Sphingobacterium allocomposti]|uniref:helix-turn-helix domain-containing protein n=1 Tax=Sphingobacterium allocomposti TaxID=415956 RepID=UPI001478A1DD|nr:helix-turn-helix domain-containing protein [Sphingobacterium composti Yoo et al. 2007 non Ten et al. 2007]HLS96558.1 helix-turn-helix domain-containing protein [Sphingobacterium sp.]
MLEILKRIAELLACIIDLLGKNQSRVPGSPSVAVTPPGNITTDSKRLYGVTEVMDILGISHATYYRFVRSGRLVPRKLGKRHYYYLEDLEAQLEESKRRGRI